MSPGRSSASRDTKPAAVAKVDRSMLAGYASKGAGGNRGVTALAIKLINRSLGDFGRGQLK